MATGTDWIAKLKEIRSGTDGGLGGTFADTIEKLLFLPVVAFVLQLANVLEALFNVFILPTNALVSGIVGFLTALFDGVARVIAAGARGSTGVQQFSLLGLPLALFIVVLTAMVLAWYTDQEFTSDLIPFTASDFPIIGNDEEQ